MPKVRLLQYLRVHDSVNRATRVLMQAITIALQWLPKRWPAAFSDETKLIHLLAVAVRDQVLEATKAEPDAPNAKIVLRALGIWSKSRPYVRALAQSRENINLDGSVASLVADTRRANTA